MNLPVAVLTDVDIREYEKIPQRDSKGKILKDSKKRTIYDYIKRDSNKVSKETSEKITILETQYNQQNVKALLHRIGHLSTAVHNRQVCCYI